jgi:hypothetical protein
LHLLALARLTALVVATKATLHVGLFGWIEAAASASTGARGRRHLPIVTTYTLAAVAALRGLLSLGLA